MSEEPKASEGGLRFQLIPVSESDRPPVGEVVERVLKEGQSLRFGRQVMRDGQAVAVGPRKASDTDVWFASKVVSRVHAELWVKDGALYIKDIGSSSGTFLNKLRLSPSGKESRPYTVKQGDCIQLGIDYKGKTEDLYRSVIVKLGFHDQTWVNEQRKKSNPIKFRTALSSLLAATNPYATGEAAEPSGASTDCCICIGAIAPYQALFIAPCSHCYHYKCVRSLLTQSAMFQCPLCRQVANLTASVSSESLVDDVPMDKTRKGSDVVEEGGLSVRATSQDLASSVTPVPGSPRRSITEEDHPIPRSLTMNVQAEEPFEEQPSRTSRLNSATPDAIPTSRKTSISADGEKKQRKMSLTAKFGQFFRGEKHDKETKREEEPQGHYAASSSTSASTKPAEPCSGQVEEPSSSIAPLETPNIST